MSSRSRITLGLALLVPVMVMLAREVHWLALPITLFGMFLIVWGRAPTATEKLIGKLPGGRYVLAALNQLDMILIPRDKGLENHLRKKIEAYDPRRRAALRELLTTRHAGPIGSDWTVFNQDGLVAQDFAGPGPIKEEFRDPIKRILNELGTE
jgi:hypothetical protein